MLNHELDNLSGQAVTTSRASKSIARDNDEVARSANSAGTGINQLTGRLRVVAEVAALIGPAAVPITAVAVPAITALAGAGVLAAAGLGATLLAVHGMGDAFKALNTYELDPTAENLATVQQKLDSLTPAAAAFTLHAYDMRDSITAVRDASASGLFPGLDRSLDDLDHMTPVLARFMHELGTVTGDLAAEGADAFDSQRAREFVRFMQSEARPALEAMFDITKNLAGAAGSTWEAFAPLNGDVLTGLVHATERLDESAQNMSETQGFQEFVDYVRDEGPQVLDTLGSVADMFLQIVEAAAPLGGPALQGIEMVADAVSTIADSPLGTPIFSAVAALTLLNRTMSVTAGLMTRAGLTGAGGAKITGNASGVFGAIRSSSTSASTSVRSLTGDLRIMTTTAMTAGARSGREMDRFNAAASRTKATLASSAKVAGGAGLAVGALALLTSGAADKMDMTNTATLGLAGSMAGPYGAALGATIGAVMDAAGANDAFYDSFAQFERSGTIEGQAAALADLQAAYDAFAAAQIQGTTGNWMDGSAQKDLLAAIGTGFKPSSIKNSIEDLFGQSDVEEQAAVLQQAQEEYTKTAQAVAYLGDAWAGFKGPTTQIDDTARLTEILTRAEPAMHALGISLDDLSNADPSTLREYADEIADWNRHADSAAGRTESVAAAVRDLGNDALSTADSASQLSTAIQALLSPSIDAEEATDAWRTALQTLQKELHDDAGFKGFTKNAMENRSMTRDYANAAMARLTALAGKSTTTERDMANAVKQTRQEFIKSGIAAGISKKEITARANALGLTPKLVRTVFKAAGISKVDLEVRAAKKTMDSLPKDVRTNIRANGIPQTTAAVNALVDRYDLTEKQREALVTLRDLAGAPLRRILGWLDQADSTNAQPSASLDDGAFRAAANAVVAELNRLDGMVATTYVTTVRRGGVQDAPAADGALFHRDRGQLLQTFASGGFAGRIGNQQPQVRPYTGPRGILWSEEGSGPWEAFISGHPHKVNRSRTIADEVVQRLGGQVRWMADGGLVQRHRVPAQPASRAAASHHGYAGPLEVTGTLQTPFGPAQIHGIARQAARAEIGAEKRYQDRLNDRD